MPLIMPLASSEPRIFPLQRIAKRALESYFVKNSLLPHFQLEYIAINSITFTILLHSRHIVPTARAGNAYPNLPE